MYSYIASFIASLIAVTLAYTVYWRKDRSVPSVSILEFLPNGLLHPLLADPLSFRRIMNELADRMGPVFYTWIGMEHVLFTSNAEDIAYATSSNDFKRPNMILRVFGYLVPGGLVTMSPDLHRALRKTMMENMSNRVLRSFQVKMNECVSELCNNLRKSSQNPNRDESKEIVDLTDTLAHTTFRFVTDIALGTNMSPEQQKVFSQSVDAVFDEFMKEMLGYPFRQLLGFTGIRKKFFASKKKMYDICDVIIAKRGFSAKARKYNPNPQDYLDVLLNLDSVDHNRLRSLIVEFMMAGVHAPNQVVSWSIYETCCNERVVLEIEKELEKVVGGKPRDEPLTYDELSQLEYIRRVWKETLRVHAVANVVTRVATSNVTLRGSGVRIPKGGKVVAFVPRLHVDPAVWTDPEEFKPERWEDIEDFRKGNRATRAYFPYGSGRVSCAGRAFAEYEGPLILAELHRRFRFSLACLPEEVISCSGLVETPRYSSKKDGVFDMGVPVTVTSRGR